MSDILLDKHLDLIGKMYEFLEELQEHSLPESARIIVQKQLKKLEFEKESIEIIINY